MCSCGEDTSRESLERVCVGCILHHSSIHSLHVTSRPLTALKSLPGRVCLCVCVGGVGLVLCVYSLMSLVTDEGRELSVRPLCGLRDAPPGRCATQQSPRTLDPSLSFLLPRFSTLRDAVCSRMRQRQRPTRSTPLVGYCICCIVPAGATIGATATLHCVTVRPSDHDRLVQSLHAPLCMRLSRTQLRPPQGKIFFPCERRHTGGGEATNLTI